MTKTPNNNLDQTEQETSKIVIPRIEEELELKRIVRETGRVRVTKSVHSDSEVISTPVTIHDVEIKRVPKDQILQQPALTRQEDGVTIIPVMEEIVVVTKQLVLREEIHLIRIEKTDEVKQEISVLKETVDIERLKAE